MLFSCIHFIFAHNLQNLQVAASISEHEDLLTYCGLNLCKRHAIALQNWLSVECTGSFDTYVNAFESEEYRVNGVTLGTTIGLGTLTAIITSFIGITIGYKYRIQKNYEILPTD